MLHARPLLHHGGTTVWWARRTDRPPARPGPRVRRGRRHGGSALGLPLLLAAIGGTAAGAAAQETDAARDSLAIPVPAVEVRLPRAALDPTLLPHAVTLRDLRPEEAARPGTSLEEVLRSIPGLQVDDRFNLALGERISIRGFGARSAFGVRGVEVVVDGLPATLPDGQTPLGHVDPATVAAVEVLRGPMAVLYGNAAGGLVHLRSAPPPAAPWGHSARVAATPGGRRLHLSGGGRAGRLEYGATAGGLWWDGFRAHDEATVQRVGLTVARRGAGGGELRLRATGVDWDAKNPGALTLAQWRADPRQAQSVNVQRKTGETGRQAQAGATWRTAVAAGELELAIHGLVRTLDNPIPVAVIDLDRRAGGFRAIHRSPTGGRLDWSAGLEIEGQRDERRNRVNEDGAPGALTLDQRESVRAAAAFLHLGWTAIEPLVLSAGLRRDRIRFAAEDRRVTDTDPDDSGRRTLSAWSPAVGGTLRLGPRAELYGSFSTAFETPTTTELANRPDGAGGFNPELEPQRTRSWEAGGRWRGDRARVEAAAYRARVEDALIPFEVAELPGRAFFRNAGSAVHRGVELALEAGDATGLYGRLAYAWTDARFERFATEAGDHAGRRVPGVAPHRLATYGAWRGSGGGFAQVEPRIVGRVPVDDAGTAFAPAHAVVDVRAGWARRRTGGYRWTASLGVANLLDADYAASVVVNAFGGRHYEPGPGRRLELVVEVGSAAATE